MKFIKKLFINSWIRYLVSFVIGLIIAVIYLSLNGFKYFYNYVNAISTAGISLIFIGLLSLVSYLGAFYAFGYGFSQIFGNKSNYKDLYDYTARKIEIRKRKNFIFMPYIIVGIIFVIISLILMCFN